MTFKSWRGAVWDVWAGYGWGVVGGSRNLGPTRFPRTPPARPELARGSAGLLMEWGGWWRGAGGPGGESRACPSAPGGAGGPQYRPPSRAADPAAAAAAAAAAKGSRLGSATRSRSRQDCHANTCLLMLAACCLLPAACCLLASAALVARLPRERGHWPGVAGAGTSMDLTPRVVSWATSTSTSVLSRS